MHPIKVENSSENHNGYSLVTASGEIKNVNAVVFSRIESWENYLGRLLRENDVNSEPKLTNNTCSSSEPILIEISSDDDEGDLNDESSIQDDDVIIIIDSVSPPPLVSSSNVSVPNSINNFTKLTSKPFSKTPDGEHLCSFCRSAFPNSTLLSNHLESHVNNLGRRHVCEYCGKGFKLAHHMKDHTRVHTGEQPFACGYCKRKFARSCVLKAHERTHIKKKPSELRQP